MTDNDTSQIARVAVKIPPLWKNNIHIWFVQVEANFEIAKITEDITKYHTVLAAIDSESLSAISDLILNPPTTNKYDSLKERLIKEFSDSQTQQIRKLLSELTLGDKRPSVLLRQMKELANNTVKDEFLQTIWLERLPTYMQTILSVSSASLNELAILADKIAEIKTDSNVFSISNSPSRVADISSLRVEIAELRQQVNDLALSFHRFRTSNRRNRSNSHNSRPPHPHRQFAPNERKQKSDSAFCYYHERFGESATKCRSPCSFHSKN